MTNQIIDGELLFAQNAINNAMNVQPVLQAVTSYGYDQPRLMEGLALYDVASRLNERQKKEYGEQFEATGALRVVKAEAGKVYMTHVKIARVALKNNIKAGQSMQLDGSRKSSLSGWIGQAKAFYANALDDDEAMAGLARYGTTREILEAGQAAILGVEQKFNARLKETGEAQQATLDRDVAFDELQSWMSDFTKVARVALEGQPQYLEMLGIVEPS